MALTLRPYQEETLDALRKGFAQGKKAQILYSPTGGGKCLGKGTPIVMADATIKRVEDIVVGDRLASPTGGYRKVLSLAQGREEMYRVTPVKGDPYIVNASHLLSLKKTTTDHCITLSDGTIISPQDDIVTVSADVFYHSSKTARHVLKGWRSAVNQFENQQPLPIDPYILGVWLGDGTLGNPHITKPFGPVIEAWIDYGKSIGLNCNIEKYGDRCEGWRLTNGIGQGTNPFTKRLDDIGVLHNKHIPRSYLAASIEDRRQLIAGLLDTDGSMSKSGFDWISKSKELAEQMAFLCRSVGLACYVSECTKGIKSRGFVGTYWRCSISGNCDVIPCKQKKAPARLQIKRHLVTGITLEPIGVGDYYGFELDGDKLFLLGDFTVTHNTEMAIALLNATKQKGNRAAMLLDRIILCDQTSQRLEKYSIDHGVLQSGHWRYRPYEPIQVCSAQTLERRGSFPGLQLLIVDEAHQSRAQTVEFIKANPEIKVIGLTATPFTKGLGKVYDNVVSTVTTKELVDQKVLVPLRVFVSKEINMEGAKKIAGEWSSAEIEKRGMVITGDIVTEWIKKTHELFGKPEKTIVFCAGVAHGTDLMRKFNEQGYNFVAISYKDDEQFKRDIIEDFAKPDTEIHGLIATDVLTKGFDNPDVKIGVSARPFSKSLSSHIQQMGRVMRGAPNKDFALWLDHSGNFIRFRQEWEEIFENGVHSLDDGREKPKKEPTDKEKKDSVCPRCEALWPKGSDTCAHCGLVRERKNQVVNLPGMMEEIGAMQSTATKQQWWSMLNWYVQHMGWSNGRAAHTYREKFGVWPRGLSNTPMRPIPEVEKFIQKRLRAYINKIKRAR